MTNIDKCIKKQRHHFSDKGPYTQGYGLYSSHVQMWELDHKEDRLPKKWYFQIVMLEKTLESLLDCKEIKSVTPKGNKSWILIGRTDAEAKAPILWSPDAKSWLIEKDLDVGKDWRQKKRSTENEMVRWYHWFKWHELGQTLGAGEAQRSLACCIIRDCKNWAQLGNWIKLWWEVI